MQAIRIFDTDENGLALMERRYGSSDKVRILQGDIRHRDRIRFAMDECTSIFHAAAAKNLLVTEKNVPELIGINCGGTIELSEVAIEQRIERMMFISSDKSVDFASAYGQTKFLGERIMDWANSIASPRSLFASCRFPNVMESRGNVFEVWREMVAKEENIPLTDPESTRFVWHMDEAVNFILKCWDIMKGGETFIPRGIKEHKMGDIAEFYASRGKTDIIGSRLREARKAKLFTEEEGLRLEEHEGLHILRG